MKYGRTKTHRDETIHTDVGDVQILTRSYDIDYEDGNVKIDGRIYVELVSDSKKIQNELYDGFDSIESALKIHRQLVDGVARKAAKRKTEKKQSVLDL